MKPTRTIPDNLRATIDLQAGVVSRDQLVEQHISDHVVHRLTRQGWVHLGPGVYATRPPEWRSLAWAGVLLGGPGAALGALTAAHLDDFAPEPSDIFVWTPTRRRSMRRLGNLDLVLQLGFRDSHGSPPRTSIEDTLIDASQRLETDADVVAMVSRAMQHRRTTRERLSKAASMRRRLRYRQLLNDLCATTAAGVESVLEWRFVHDVVTAHSLPAPELQRSVIAGARVDALFREQRLVTELDGERWHRARTQQDRWRDNEHVVAAGVQTLRYGTEEVLGSPCVVAAQLARALSARGWAGAMRRCPRCADRPPAMLTRTL